MGRRMTGVLIVALAMFFVGFCFYATPLSSVSVGKAPDATGAAIQSALRALPAPGFYVIPDPSTAVGAAAFATGPTAFVHVANGRPPFDPLTLVKGAVHYLVVATLLIITLAGVPAGNRARIAIFIAAIAVVFIHLGGPIWWSYNWRTMMFFAVADFVTLTVGGLVATRFLRSEQA